MDLSQAWFPGIHPRGAVFNRSVDVTFSSRTPGAVIRYTLDGREPNESSAVYEKAVTLNRTTTVRAKAWKAGMRSSAVSRMRFTRTDAGLPDNPAPHAPAGDPPFEVFPAPNPDWTPPAK